jgi:sucrose phosphorylase
MNTTKLRELWLEIYGRDAGASTIEKLLHVLRQYNVRNSTKHFEGPNQRESILITYPDQVRQAGLHPLSVLADFCERHFMEFVTGIHILPFYPWTSDDGFSVTDYRRVDPRYGDWDDIRQIGRHFRLMFDAVINHISVGSSWFRGMLAGDERYRDYFISPAANDDLTRVVRPRALPLLTAFQTSTGEKKFWTTFSADQVDLNYSNPDVLLEIVEILLLYVSQGADFIRLDAIGYLWKESGTSCIHLPQTHRIIQLFRGLLDEVAPDVMLITETNVPHADNISYFGDGANEAQMVYNFSLPPLTLHAFQTGSAEILSRWAASLELPSDKVTFFNFLASHDGIGLNPLRGILPETEIEVLVRRAQSHGGLVSYKMDLDGTERPYELNISYFDALNDPNVEEPLDLQVDRFVAAHAILLAMRGVPGIYFHSFFGTRNWLEGVHETAHNRTINRRKFERRELETALADPNTRESRVLFRLGHLLKIRRRHAEFHPAGSQQVLYLASAVFALLRVSPDGSDQVLCLQNVSDNEITVNLRQSAPAFVTDSRNLIDGQNYVSESGDVLLRPYQTLWLH